MEEVRVAFAVLTSVASLGCTQIPKTQPYTPHMGAKTCGDLGRAAINRSTEEFLAGTVTTAIGVTGIVAGMLMGPDTAPEASWHERNRYLFVIAPSAVLATIGVGIAARSQQTDALGDKAWTAMAGGKNEEDRYLYYECVSARADWSGDRSELTRLQIHLMKENLAALKAAQEAASEATKKESAAPKTESATPPLSAPGSPVLDKQR